MGSGVSILFRSRGKTFETSDLGAISAQLETEISNLARQIKDGRNRKIAIFKAASILRSEIKTGVRVWRKSVSRYSSGKKVATYTPGNLKRSIKILSHMRDKENKYVGVERQPKGGSKGTFSGSRTDGYYGHMVEAKRPYVKPGTLRGREKAKAIILEALKKDLLGRS